MRKDKIIFIIGVLLLLGLFFFPLWNITLEAPQYPDSLGMDIWITKIADHNPNDIKNINLMNHYVGMADINLDMIEFTIFPIVIGVMVALGVLIGFTGNKKLFLGWIIVMVLLGIAGMYDFYAWEYEYGHNLNPHAAIKIPGQAYQPPLLGSKKILNFKATSLPGIGAYLMTAGLVLTCVAVFLSNKKEAK
ncbi:MAG: hypothetical protein ACK5MD_05330 [Flavobacteriales bacterium]